MTEDERDAFINIASGFHHGERQVEVDLVPFMMAGTEEDKIFISSQIEDEARHTVFFDRFYREVVGLEGDRSEERRVGKGVDLGGRRIIKKKSRNRIRCAC